DAPSEVEVSQRGGDLVDLLHPGAARPEAGEHHHLAGLDAVTPLALDRGDGGPLAGEDVRRPDVPVDAVGPDEARIDRRALHDRALGREVAADEAHRA